METLDRTPTHAGSDARGRAFGLAGNLFLWPVGGAVAGIGLMLLLRGMLGWSIGLSICFGVAVFVTTVAYVVLLRHNRPSGYDRDWLDNQFGGRGVSFRWRVLRHPRQG